MKDLDLKYYLAGVELARKRGREFGDKVRHVRRMYDGRETPRLHAPMTFSPLNVNEVYGDIEIGRNAVGFRNPRVVLQAAQPNFYVVTDPGDPDRRLIGRGDLSPEVFELLERVPPGEAVSFGDLIYRRLDGVRSARINTALVNWNFTEKRLADIVEQVKVDAQMGLGGLWVDFQGPMSLPCHDSEYLRDGDISFEYVDLALPEVVFDPMVTRLGDLHKARWIARRFVKTADELEDLRDLEYEGRPFFNKSALNDLIARTGVSSDDGKSLWHMVNDADGDEKKFFDMDQNRGIVIWQLWHKPGYKDRVGDGKFKRGYVIYLAEGYEAAPLTRKFPWPHRMDGFPVEVLSFNAANDRVYPVGDVEIYESQLVERNMVRHYQRKHLEFISRIKILIRGLDPDVKAKLNNASDSYIDMPPEFVPKEDVFHFAVGTPSGDFMAADQQIAREKDRISLISGTQRGQTPHPKTSATSVAVSDRSASSRLGFRTEEVAKLYKRLSRKTVQLAQQYYTEDRVIFIVGHPRPEWTDVFSREVIQGEYHAEVDIMSMNPLDEIAMQNRFIQFLDIAVGLFKDQNTYRKILSEGREINLSEVFLEIIRRMNVNNARLFPLVPENVATQASLAIFQSLGIMQPPPGVPSPQASAGGGLNRQIPRDEIPNPPPGHELNPGLEPGRVMPAGGGPKVGDDLLSQLGIR